MDGRSCGDRVANLVRVGAMASLAFDCEFKARRAGQDWTFTNSDIALVKIGNVMKAVDLVDAVEAALLDHGKCTSRTFLRRLEQ